MVQNQTYLFLVFSLTGVAIGILFDFFRILRKSFKTADIITYIEDVLFWILTGVLVLYNIWYFNNGEIRIFMFLSIIIGIMIYMLTLSSILIKIFHTTLNIVKNIVNKVINILKIPFKPIILALKKIYVLIKGKITKNVKKITDFSSKKGKLEKNGE
ncbi:MAG: spore cortex biosynthesis protein YabQ [Clostridia bacterium]|jgi:spore cortex biosynthesis protein YabQ|nr:spore cortex biosynthesis protein YabQ [Clostridia bacterium]